jgi:hypothetical protein
MKEPTIFLNFAHLLQRSVLNLKIHRIKLIRNCKHSIVGVTCHSLLFVSRTLTLTLLTWRIW